MTNQRLQMAYDYAVYTHRNIFLTGKAGTGKTTLLHHLKDQCRKRIVVVAPTGVAAINAGGVTIHSFFQIAPGLHLPDNKVNRNRQNQLSKAKLKTIRSIDLLIIDEISMVRCDLLDEIDATLRRVRHDQRPFAGIQMLLIGDMQQLAPVTSESDWELLRPYYRTPYFFSSTALMKTDYVTIELDTVFRQQDEDFVDILNHVRDNTLSAQMLLKLNARYNPTFNPPDNDYYITLTTHNHQAAGINSIKLESLKTPSVIFEARIEGDFPATSYPNDASLRLKVGTQVMFCKNDPDIERRFYNGKIGTIESIDEYDQRVCVACGDERIIVTPLTWYNNRYVPKEDTGEIVEETVGAFTQIPLRPAWAITIHKSQGLTFERMIIDAGHAFSPGQVYVALSRCRTLQGIVLSTPITPNVVLTDREIVSYNAYVQQNQPTEEQLQQDRIQYLYDALCDIFDYEPLYKYLTHWKRMSEEYLSKLYPEYIAHLAYALPKVYDELVLVGIRFRPQLHQLLHETDLSEGSPLQKRHQQASRYFLNKLNETMSQIIDHGCPETDNKAVAAQLERQYSLIREEYRLHQLLLTANQEQFSLENYWKARAQAAMNDSDTDRKKGRGKRLKEHKSDKAEVQMTANESLIANSNLVESLRQWRTETANSQHVPAYIVMHNNVLLQIAREEPLTKDQLLAIKGISRKRYEQYGEQILRIVRQHQ